MDANGISIHFELAGEGPSVVLLHEMGGTLASWDGIFPALSAQFRTLRYDQRGSGLSEKVRQPITTELLVDDLEAVLQASALPAPYHFVTVAAATMQALIFMTRHPDRVGVSRSAIRSPGPIRAAWRRSKSARRWPSAKACAKRLRSRSTSPGLPISASAPPMPPIARATSPMIRSALPR